MPHPKQTLALHAFAGEWTGTAAIYMGTIHLKGYQSMKVVANGWALQGHGRWTNEDQSFVLEESFQGAYDAPSNKIHWQVMYSQGPQAFTVPGLFNDLGDILTLNRSYPTPDGMCDETGVWTFLSKEHRELLIESKVGGQVVYRLTADVVKNNC